ncbi:MAG: cupin-like domain-containing protein [Chitinophagaceae bacterium]|nr:cupin-like domain-containing protein [Chitinophagaceae bacterium]MCA6452476.1 cupin-like domain-containing protein [Chitinophagaceae bacterium]MCA6455169.1 cupin-like domain-containing protein [Chitinophagaceae bacterium]MCA6459989.1 cupin-like domain-containing protein [Chitinophagaceae bacterium]MCA6465848.1 cupin-like domain-containing protein [Chitinophagaceae bacterium]
MQLQPVDVVDEISADDFRQQYYLPMRPLVIRNLAKTWPAYEKWNWNYFKELVGDQRVALYNNTKSDAYTPINTADDYKTFGEYIDMIKQGPAAWRIFLFNIFDHAPQLTQDFTWPEHLMKGFVKKYPMLFTGGATSITHMHFDIDLSHILHTQFAGRKRILLFPHSESDRLYRKPFEVLSLADFSNYYDPAKSKLDYQRFPALTKAHGFDLTLNHGETLFMPAGYWHHMEYLDSGFAMSLRALQPSITGKLTGVWNLFGMRTIDTVMKKTLPQPWYNWKRKRIFDNAGKAL